MISVKEQSIYNAWLATSRSIHNKPFKIRQDFSKFDAEKEVAVKRISNILDKYPHIRLNEFFSAPYHTFDMEDHFDLNFYTTQKALKSYSLYKKKLEMDNADSEFNLVAVVDSLKFLKEYCNKKQCNIDEYIGQNDGMVPVFFNHIKEHKVSFYCLFGFENFEKSFRAIDKDILFLAFSDSILNKLQIQKVKFLNSDKCKILVRTGIKKLQNI